MVRCWLAGLTGLLAAAATAAVPEPTVPVTVATVDATRPLGPIGELVNVGYNGWGDITNPGMVRAFTELGVRYCRLDINLRELCGDRPGDYRWDYRTPADGALGFTDRVNRVLACGWTPVLVFSYHGGWQALPTWFHGDTNDAQQKGWTRYNRDGSPGPDGLGNQLACATAIARDCAAKLAALGQRGLFWETLYEMNPDMPLVEIHHAVATGVRAADPAARLMGPATWPGWSVEERFVKPYLRTYGADLLDVVSVHWYGSNDHDLWKLWANEPEGWTLTLAHDRYTAFLLERTALYRDWTRALAALLADHALNPTGKPIGIFYTELDVNATSYYLRNPENPDWPRYRSGTDCWLNTNYFGGVWWASVLGHIAAAGAGAHAAKFNTRNYYGLQEGTPNDGAYRYPVWFALRLLRDQGGLAAGRQSLATAVAGEGVPWVEAFATGDPADLRVTLVNKSTSPHRVEVQVTGLAAGPWQATEYRFDRTRVASFRGRRPGDKADGTFEGYPDSDAASQVCLTPVDTLVCTAAGPAVRTPAVTLPPISFAVLTFEPPHP